GASRDDVEDGEEQGHAERHDDEALAPDGRKVLVRGDQQRLSHHTAPSPLSRTTLTKISSSGVAALWKRSISTPRSRSARSSAVGVTPGRGLILRYFPLSTTRSISGIGPSRPEHSTTSAPSENRRTISSTRPYSTW